jgi:hypothetical protein
MAWRCRREKLRRSCGGRVTDGGDNGATGDLGSDGHRKAAEAMDDAGGAADGVPVVPSIGSSNRRAGPFPPWTPVSLGQQSTVRPADGDRPDEKTLDGQAGVGDDVTAADLGPDPDAATRLSPNELAGMETASSTASAVHSPMSQPSASAMTVWRRGQPGIGSHCVRPVGNRYTPPPTGIVAARAGASPRR